MSASQFHNELLNAEESGRFKQMFDELYSAVHAALRMLNCIRIEWEKQAFGTKEDHHITSIAIVTDFAEAIDGVSLLLAGGSARNCPQLLRTALEIQLGLKYLLETKADYRSRALAYEFFHHRDNLRWAEKCDPDSETGKQYRTETKGHQFADIFDGLLVCVKDEILHHQSALNSERYKAIRDEISRMRAEKKRVDNWFGLFGGPTSLRDMAYRLKEGPLYEVLYRAWSTTSHGEGGLKRFSFQRGGVSKSDPLRSPKNLPNMARDAFNMCNVVSFLLAEELGSNFLEETRIHFRNQVRDGLARIERWKI